MKFELNIQYLIKLSVSDKGQEPECRAERTAETAVLLYLHAFPWALLKHNLFTDLDVQIQLQHGQIVKSFT